MPRCAGVRAGCCAIPTGSRAFSASARASQTRPRALALHGLINASLKLHRDWIVRAGAPERIRETGWLKAWRSDNVAAAKADQDALAAYGIKSELLDRQAISALEPNILPVYSVGLLHTQTASVDSPGNVVKAYARMLSGSGGEVRRAEIRSIVPDGDGWRVVLSDGEISRAPCRGRARAVVGGSAAAARLSRAARHRARLSPRIQAEPVAQIAAPDP